MMQSRMWLLGSEKRTHRTNWTYFCRKCLEVQMLRRRLFLYLMGTLLFVCPLSLSGLSQRKSASSGVQVVPNEGARRVDVTIDGQPFTSYIWPDTVKKPVLYPLRTVKGTLVTRGYPLDPRPGERVDHPHHVGLWFNYGDVSGVDFWNNSDALPKEQQARMGRIVHRAIASTKSGAGEGSLEVDA